MSDLCERVQAALVDAGPGAFKDDTDARAHLVECAECFGVLEASATLDAELATLPAIDAPAPLVASTLARITTEAGFGPARPTGDAAPAAAHTPDEILNDEGAPSTEDLEPESAAEQAALSAAIAQAVPKPGTGAAKPAPKTPGRFANLIARGANRIRGSVVGWLAARVIALPLGLLRVIGGKLRPLSTPFADWMKGRWQKASPLMRRWITVSALGGGGVLGAAMLLVMVSAVGGDSKVGMTGIWEEGQLEIPRAPAQAMDEIRSNLANDPAARPGRHAGSGAKLPIADKLKEKAGDDRDGADSSFGGGGLGLRGKGLAGGAIGGEIAAAPEEPMPSAQPADIPAPIPNPVKTPASRELKAKSMLDISGSLRREMKPKADAEPEPEFEQERIADTKLRALAAQPAMPKPVTVLPSKPQKKRNRPMELASIAKNEASRIAGVDGLGMDLDDLKEAEEEDTSAYGDAADLNLEGTETTTEEAFAEFDRDARNGKDQVAQGQSQSRRQRARRPSSTPTPDNRPDSPTRSAEMAAGPTGRISGVFRTGKKDANKEGRLADLRWAQLVPVDTTVAQTFLDEHRSIENLTFKNPIGYWANTYVPGDPELRLLQNKLSNYDRSAVARFAPGPVRMHDAASTYAQPFDPPTGAALGVYVNASEASVEGPTRMLLQVGLQGTPRYSGRRPAMNIGVVLDLRGTVDREASAAMRALLTALNDARDITDRFTLVVAGQPGGVVLEPESFRHGPLMVTTRRLFSETPVDDVEPGPVLSLPEAMQEAMGAVAQSDDPTAPLGSSSVMLITSQTIAGLTGWLSEMAHASAVNGVPVSTVGIGSGVRPEELATVTLAGQGNRRLLSSAAEAQDAVDRELSAVARVVARAVRLRIRLAPGVKLVDIIGSHRLDEERAERVRQAEQSIDRRLSRNLGLVSDRGEDEDGVQIVIPSYYAGDSHAILLDVVVPKAGPVADVRVRFKDLVYLKNGVAAATFQMPRGTRPKGPLQYSVLKNLVAHDVAQSLRESSEALARGADMQTVLAPLQHAQQLVTGLPQIIPGFWSDRGLSQDLVMLREYIALLQQGAHNADRDQLRDSLRFAGFLKVQPRPPQ